MKANWTIWNKLVVALSGILLFWVIAPRHDCFCGEMHACEPRASAAHDCCQHECCSHESESGIQCGSQAAGTFQNKSCRCSSERALFGELRVANTLPENNPEQASTHTLVSEVSAGDSELCLLRLTELNNDDLKPCKIFLLKRALLN
jgi:hypothetical protein